MTTIEELTEFEEIKAIAEEFGFERKNLLPILNEIQKRKKYVSAEAQQIVADLLGIHPVEVFGVVSFYHFLDAKPKGENVVRLCKSISCELNGKEEIKEAIEETLGIRAGETTRDGKFSFEEINCFGLCDVGPAIMVNEKVYARVTREKAKEILTELAEK